MLGLMKMSITECIDHYKNFMNVVFPTGGASSNLVSAFTGTRWDDAPLVAVIKGLIQQKLGNPEVLLLDKSTMNNPCKVYVQSSALLSPMSQG